MLKSSSRFRVAAQIVVVAAIAGLPCMTASTPPATIKTTTITPYTFRLREIEVKTRDAQDAGMNGDLSFSICRMGEGDDTCCVIDNLDNPNRCGKKVSLYE